MKPEPVNDVGLVEHEGLCLCACVSERGRGFGARFLRGFQSWTHPCLKELEQAVKPRIVGKAGIRGLNVIP